MATHRIHSKRMARKTTNRSLRSFAYLALVVVVLGATGYLLVAAFSPKVPAAAANTIDVTAEMSGFNMKEIRIKVGQPVTLRLTSLDSPYHTDGGGKHQWAVDELGLNVIAPPKGSNSITFTPDRTGTFTFYCDICCGGRANPTMQGKLIVEGA